jgi:hypothetical protein
MEVRVGDDGRITWHIEGPEAEELIAGFIAMGYSFDEIRTGLHNALNDPVVEPLAKTGP